MIEDYIDLKSADNVTGTHFHSMHVRRVRKRDLQNANNGQAKRKKFTKTWVLKPLADPNWIPHDFIEVPIIVSELHRLWAYTTQPKTRLVVNNPLAPTTFNVLSEEVVGFKPFTDPAVLTALRDNKTSGLASLLVISLALGQADLSPLDIGMDKGGNFVHFDDDHALCLFWHNTENSGFSFKITSGDIESLPLVKDYSPHRWLDYKSSLDLEECGSMSLYSTNISHLSHLSKDFSFLQEKYLTLLKIILTPDFTIEAMIRFDSKLKNEATKQRVFNFIKARKRALENEAFLIKGFRDFVFSEGENYLKYLTYSLEEFELTGKVRAKQLCPNMNALIKDKFDSIKNSRNLEIYVLEQKKYSLEYTRQAVKEIIIDRIRSINTISQVQDAVKELESLPEYRPLRTRQHNIQWSFWGHKHNGKDISKAFSDILKVAKTRISNIALHNARAGDLTDLTMLLEQEEYRSFIMSNCYRP